MGAAVNRAIFQGDYLAVKQRVTAERIAKRKGKK